MIEVDCCPEGYCETTRAFAEVCEAAGCVVYVRFKRRFFVPRWAFDLAVMYYRDAGTLLIARALAGSMLRAAAADEGLRKELLLVGAFGGPAAMRELFEATQAE